MVLVSRLIVVALLVAACSGGAAETTTTSLDRDSTTSSSTSTTTTTVEQTTTTDATTTTASTPTTASSGTLVLDLLTAIPVELETQSGYNRDLFEVWSDEDGDGCDTRAEVLIEEAVEGPSIGSGCDVGAGLWWSAYDDVWLDHARQLQVDHVVSLKEAWDSGAKDWDSGRRIAFGNDLTSPLTLIAVSSSANSDKGDADPSNWLPPQP